MTLTAYLPRLGLFDRAARRPKHSAPAEVDRLRSEVERLRRFLSGAHALIAGLQMREAETEAKQGAAEELVVQQQADIEELTLERNDWRDWALRLQARFGAQIAAEDNANAVTVPPSIRPIDGPEDQATGPIYVQTLRDAAAAGHLGPVFDPGHATTH